MTTYIVTYRNEKLEKKIIGYGKKVKDALDDAKLKHMIKETDSLLAKYNARIRQLDRKIGLAFGYTDEELDKMDKFVDDVVGATIGGMVASILLDDDEEGTDE